MCSERPDACMPDPSRVSVQAETSNHFMTDTPYQMLEVSIVGRAASIVNVGQGLAALGEGIRQLLHELRITVRTERHLLADFVQQQHLAPVLRATDSITAGENCGSA